MPKNNQQSVPNLRFPTFEHEWVRKPLSAILRPKRVRNAAKEFSRDDVLSVSGESGVINQIEHLGRSYAGLSMDNYHVVEHGDIVYTKSPLKRNPYGIIKANKGKPGIVSTLYAVYEVKSGHSFAFWDRYFELDDRTNRYLKPLVNKGAKNDMKINNERVLIDPVYFPSFIEQENIAAFFEVIDEKLNALRRKSSLLTDYKRGVMQQLFSRALRFKRDNGGDFPDWREMRISEIGDIYGGLSGKSADDFGSGLPFVTYKQIFDSSYVDLALCQLVRVGESETQNVVLAGDILFTTSSETPNEVGFASVVLESSPRLYLNSFCFGLRPKGPGELLPQFARYLFRNPFYREAVYPLAQGSTRYNLSRSGFLKLSLHIPTPEEQSKIANFLSTIDAKIDALTSQINKVERFKKGLLQQMFV